MPIITSLLDQDLYKCTMGQAVTRQFSDVWVKYKFKCRNKNIIWTPRMIEKISEEIDYFCTLQFTKDEIEWLSKLRYLKKDYIEFLKIYRPQREHVTISEQNGELSITVAGPWFLTIYFEVPILAIVNEVYFENITYSNTTNLPESGLKKLYEKIDLVKEYPFLFSDFGTRRRFSKEWHEQIIHILSTSLPRSIFGGTSNMYLAKKYNLTPIGTMAHEFIMAGMALEGVTLASSQKYMLQAWVNEYRGDLGIALSDTLGTDKFLKDFDLYFAKLYDGVRQDSGNPFEWGEKLIHHYESMKIDPRTKQFCWSDGLDFLTATKLNSHFHDRVKCSFGIGTNLTNDFDSVTPLNIVMKIVEVNGKPVAKISDSPGKIMCEDSEFVKYLQQVIK